MFDKSLACSIVHSLAALVEVGVADCRLSSLPSCCFSSPSRGSPGCFASSQASCGRFSLCWWCRGSGRSASVGTQAKPGPNVSCWGRPFSRRWCFAFLAAGESTGLVILFRVLLRDKQCMFSRGFWCVDGLVVVVLFVVFVLQYVVPRSSAGWCRNVFFFVILVVGILGFVIFYVFLYGIPKRRRWAGLSARTSLGQCPTCCHPLPLPALSQCDLVSGKGCRQPLTLVMDFVWRIELPGIPGVFWCIQPDGWIMSLVSWCVSL